MIATDAVTRTSTGNISLRLLAHLTFRETSGSATARITVRADSATGRVICGRTLLANESDDVDYANPIKASDDAIPLFHLTVDAGVVSVTAMGQA